MIYTLAIDGDDRPSRHDTLEGAVRALRVLLGGLHLDPAQAEAYAYFLRDPDRVQDYLDTRGAFELQFAVDGQPRTAVIRPE